MNIKFGEIKLVIWDLDDTFWQGTLSEEGITPIKENIELIKSLTDRGIVNSICSKNDAEPTEDKLKELNVADFFIFKSINWEPKGQRISNMIKEMGLRAANCLFIDDNVVNLNEAKFYEPQLQTMEPERIEYLQKFVAESAASDPTHKRLKNYKVLEEKQQAKNSASDNLEFLYSSETEVKIHYNCMEELDRIHELVNRTNQLNFTKLRSSKEELAALCQDSATESGYITVKDKFGDYGIVGFFAMKEHRLIHFLFSCRTIGQGVEQYVYATLNHPQLEVVGEVINNVTQEPAPEWINRAIESKEKAIVKKSHHKILFKGGCDLNITTEYLNTDNLINEFTYIGEEKKNWIEHHNCSVNYLNLPFLSEKEKNELLNDCIFNDKCIFDTAIYDKDISIIFLSTMIEPNLGIYRNKSNGVKIAFGEYRYPLTDPANWDAYINDTIFTAQNKFTKEWLQLFSEKYEFIGNLTPQEIVANIDILLGKIAPTAKVCYLLGSETPYLKNCQRNYDDRHIVYKEINTLIREYARNNSRVCIIDFNDYIKGQEDFTNNINHFQRRVYYAVATKANEYISNLTGEKLKQKGRFYLFYKSLIDKIGNTGFYQTSVWKLIRKPYIFLRSILNR